MAAYRCPASYGGGKASELGSGHTRGSARARDELESTLLRRRANTRVRQSRPMLSRPVACLVGWSVNIAWYRWGVDESVWQTESESLNLNQKAP